MGVTTSTGSTELGRASPTVNNTFGHNKIINTMTVTILTQITQTDIIVFHKSSLFLIEIHLNMYLLCFS